MKILNRSINFKTMEGSVKLEAEEEDEMYHLYNIIAAGDIVEASTVRNVYSGRDSGRDLQLLVGE
jgi:protein pelota